MKAISGLRFIERDGKKLLQAQSIKIGCDASGALVPNGITAWEDVCFEPQPQVLSGSDATL